MGIIILGDNYKFSYFEKKKLTQKYKLVFLPHKFHNSKGIIKDISKILSLNSDYKIIVLNIKGVPHPDLVEYLISLEFKNIKFLTIKHFLEEYLNKIYIPKDYSDISFLDNIKKFSYIQYIEKRILDFIILIPLTIIILPIIIISIYKIKKESPDGPIFFKQTRIGKDGKVFVCYKFRSMRTDIKFFNHYTQENDPRIFPWGKFMRKTRIDELPQLYNVLKGEMHIIGPRAEWDELVKKYEKKWSFYHFRHLICPGISGWAQVNYPYGQNIEDTYQKLMYDLYYIKNWSISLEIKTIFKTIWIIFAKKGL